MLSETFDFYNLFESTVVEIQQLVNEALKQKIIRVYCINKV